MRLSILSALLIPFLIACNSEVKKEVEQSAPKEEKEELVMYKASEMALLMNSFYEHNQKLKAQIEAGELALSFPQQFETIHSAVLTTPSDKDEVFTNFAHLFLNKQREIYTSEDKKEAFNNMVNTCIACHKMKCTGPIPRIKKLLIK